MSVFELRELISDLAPPCELATRFQFVAHGRQIVHLLVHLPRQLGDTHRTA